MVVAPIDICFLLIILIFAISGVVKGIVKEFFSKAAVIGGLALAIIFTPKLDFYVVKTIHNEIISKIVSFLLIFVIVFLIVCIIQQLVAKAFSGEIMKGLDRTLGLFLGIIEGLVIVAFVIVVLSIQPWFNVEHLYEGSLFYKLLANLLKIPTDYIRGLTA